MLPSLLHRHADFLSFGVDTGWIGEFSLIIGEKGLENFGPDGRCGRVIHVNATQDGLSSLERTAKFIVAPGPITVNSAGPVRWPPGRRSLQDSWLPSIHAAGGGKGNSLPGNSGET
jgi:hypothetical protein